MILNKKKLRAWEKSAHIVFTKVQKAIILERFGTEPGDGHEWSEQDIAEQVRKIVRDNPAPPPKLPGFLK